MLSDVTNYFYLEDSRFAANMVVKISKVYMCA